MTQGALGWGLSSGTPDLHCLMPLTVLGRGNSQELPAVMTDQQIKYGVVEGPVTSSKALRARVTWSITSEGTGA